MQHEVTVGVNLIKLCKAWSLSRKIYNFISIINSAISRHFILHAIYNVKILL